MSSRGRAARALEGNGLDPVHKLSLLLVFYVVVCAVLVLPCGCLLSCRAQALERNGLDLSAAAEELLTSRAV